MTEKEVKARLRAAAEDVLEENRLYTGNPWSERDSGRERKVMNEYSEGLAYAVLALLGYVDARDEEVFAAVVEAVGDLPEVKP